MKISKKNSQAYTWGEKCRGWHLVNTDGLSVIQEIMPAGTKEVNHKHHKSQQFFFILKGRATFIINNKSHTIDKNEGISIKPGIVHQIKNQTDKELEFIVVSQPHAHGDRTNENE